MSKARLYLAAEIAGSFSTAQFQGDIRDVSLLGTIRQDMLDVLRHVKSKVSPTPHILRKRN